MHAYTCEVTMICTVCGVNAFDDLRVVEMHTIQALQKWKPGKVRLQKTCSGSQDTTSQLTIYNHVENLAYDE